MFQIGEFAVCGHNGVCRVEDITTLSISGIDKNRKYYILKPVYHTSSVVYVPVDSQETSLRSVVSKKEAQELMCGVSDTALIQTGDERMLEKKYKECMKTDQCMEWLRLFKTIYVRRQERLCAGRKVTAVDEKYFRIVSDNLCGELSIALNIPREEIEKTILDHFGEP